MVTLKTKHLVIFMSFRGPQVLIDNLLNLSDVPWGGPWSTKFALITTFICGMPFNFGNYGNFGSYGNFLSLYTASIFQLEAPSPFSNFYGYSCRLGLATILFTEI